MFLVFLHFLKLACIAPENWCFGRVFWFLVRLPIWIIWFDLPAALLVTSFSLVGKKNYGEVTSFLSELGLDQNGWHSTRSTRETRSQDWIIEVEMVCLVDFLAFEGRVCGEKQEPFYQVPMSHKLNVEISHDISRRRCKMWWKPLGISWMILWFDNGRRRCWESLKRWGVLVGEPQSKEAKINLYRSCGKGLKMTKHLQISLVVVALVGWN